MSSKVRTCIWVEKDGLAAARLWTSLIPGSAIENEERFRNEQVEEAGGSAMVIDFTLAGAPYRVLQAGPHQDHTDMMSIMVTTEDQAETDRLWEALTEGGREVQCGWLKDRWGVAWQIVPRQFGEMMASGEEAKIGAMMQAMFEMKKLDIAGLRAAFDAG